MRSRAQRPRAAIESLEARRLLDALVSGQRVEDGISVVGGTVSYTFDANAGDAVSAVVDRTGGTNFVPLLQILAPDSSPLTTMTSGADLLNVTQSGTYTIVVSESGNNNTGTFALSLFRAPGPQVVDADSGPISTGQRLTGSIDIGDLDVYTFQGNAGDSISAVIGATGGVNFVPIVRIFNPDGSALSGFTSSADHLNLTQSGTYYIMVRESGDNHTGTYALSFFRAPATQPVDPDSGPITTGQRRTGSIDVGDLDVYTFDANAGDSISAVIGATGGVNFVPIVRIFNPDGSALSGFTSSADHLNLTQSGTYTIMVRESGDNHTGTYALSFFRAPATQPVDPDSGPITSGQRLIGSIDIGDLDVYTFNANAGDSISAVIGALAGVNFVPLIRVFNPDGSALSGFTNAADHLNLTQSGTYTIMVRESGDNHTGTYALSLFRAPGAQPVDPDSGPILSGQRRIGTLDTGDLDVYTFQANAGEAIYALIGATGGINFSPLIRIFRPDGSALSGFIDTVEQLNLTQSGTYTIMVRESGDNHTGEYALSFGRFPATQQPDPLDNDGGAIASGQTRSGAITPGDFDVYTVSLSAGASVTIAMARLTGLNFTPRIDLFGPNGTRLAVQTGTAAVPATIALASAPLTGTYYIVARENGDNHIGNYSIAVDTAPGPDTRPPEVTQSEFRWDVPRQQIVFTLNESIAGSLDVSDMTLLNLTTSQTIPAGNISATFNASSNQITFEFPGYPFRALPDGDYRATLNAGSVVDTAGNALPADASFEFFFLQGDANHDRRVNLADFNRLAGNFGRAAATFSQGDFNYDGVVNLADFNILAARFGNQLAAPQPTVAGRFPADSPPFGTTPIGSTRTAEDPLAELLT